MALLLELDDEDVDSRVEVNGGHSSHTGADPCADSRAGARRSAGVWLLRGPIRFYQLAISPMLPAACRYYPSCSNYAIEAIDKYGVVKGGWLAIRRISRCHPFRAGGFDPVP